MINICITILKLLLQLYAYCFKLIIATKQKKSEKMEVKEMRKKSHVTKVLAVALAFALVLPSALTAKLDAKAEEPEVKVETEAPEAVEEPVVEETEAVVEAPVSIAEGAELGLASGAVATIDENTGAENPEITSQDTRAAGKRNPNYIDPILTEINKARIAKGISPLVLNKRLAEPAMVRAQEVSDKFSHTRPNGSDFTTVFPADETTVAGEFVGGFSYYDDLVKELKKWAHLADTDWQSVGIGTWEVKAGTYYVILFSDAVPNAASNPLPTVENTQPMYRLYNMNNGEHFYTANVAERDKLINATWRYEGIAWYAPKTGIDVYRMYNKYSGEHHYTKDATEKDKLVKVGWTYEGVRFYAAQEDGRPLYRLYNKNAVGQYAAGAHHYTLNATEKDNLVKAGWKYERIGWHGSK
jgi:uncharacterized protein YkwD